MTAPDIFALGGRQDDDAEILALFRRWIAGQAAADCLPSGEEDTPENAVWQEALGRLDQIEEDITAIPAAGAIGLAVKVYLAMFYESGGTNEEAGALGSLNSGYAVDALHVSLVRDAALFVPEIGPLAIRIEQPALRPPVKAGEPGGAA